MLIQLQRELCSFIYMKMVLNEESRENKILIKEVNRKKWLSWCPGKADIVGWNQLEKN